MSTILADTVRKTGGTLGVDIRIKNNSVCESEGGTSVTTSISQGLSKAWVSRANDVSSSVEGDSFNGSSFTDTGTGSNDITMINIMNNVDFCVMNTAWQSYPYHGRAEGTSKYRIRTVNASGSSADGNKNATVHGDLA
jgi:hypothetical protein